MLKINSIKNHPISYYSIVAPLLLVTIVSYFIWIFIIFGLNRDFFIAMLSEQIALKWLWLFMTVSLTYLSFKTIIIGPLSDHNKTDVKVFGIYLGNASLAIASSWIGLAFGAIFAQLTFSRLFETQIEFILFIKLFAVQFSLLILLYIFYVILLPTNDSKSLPLMRGKVLKVLLFVFLIAFLTARVIDVIKVFKPAIFN